jgi:peptide/nickel transport system permease protein
MTITPTELELERPGEAVRGGATDAVAPPAEPASGARVLRTLRHDAGAVLSASYIGLVVLMALLAPLIVKVSGWSPYEFDQSAIDPNLGGVPPTTGSASSRAAAATSSPASSTGPGSR